MWASLMMDEVCAGACLCCVMKILQCKPAEAGAFGRMWPLVYMNSQCWSAVVQLGTQLLLQEDKGKGLGLS